VNGKNFLEEGESIRNEVTWIIPKDREQRSAKPTIEKGGIQREQWDKATRVMERGKGQKS